MQDFNNNNNGNISSSSSIGQNPTISLVKLLHLPQKGILFIGFFLDFSISKVVFSTLYKAPDGY